MITNQGPDIIVGPDIERFENTEFLVCLYSFIDSDPEISRSDFFPAVLGGFENQSGELQFISSNFEIFLYIARAETVAQVGELTYENILRWLTESDSRHFGDGWMNGEWFVRETLLTFSDEFINFDSGTAYLDTDEFINLLNIVYTLPRPEQFGYRSGDEWAEGILSGDHIFFTTYIWHVDALRLSLAGNLSPFGEILFTGVPSSPPHGQHQFYMDPLTSFGINVGSPNQEVAWSFVRRFLMDNRIGDDFVVPLRIDLFEELIAESMTPNIVDGVEVARHIWMGFPAVYAMTEEETEMLREIIDNASVRPRRNEVLENIINESLQPFFAGGATAEGTARVMQSRISIFLAERS
jgi:ABC-type glycerol-3-phosphate transport system substrate-binding protein